MSCCAIFQKIVYPLDSEGDVGDARSIQNNSISGTIWSMCFISQDPIHQSKGQNPLLAILLNRYGYLCGGSLILLQKGMYVRTNVFFCISVYIELCLYSSFIYNL